MNKSRLEELKRLVIDGLYTNETGEEEVFEHFYTISTSQQTDLLTVLQSAIDQAVKESLTTANNFERWKAQLTIERFINIISGECAICPLFECCQQNRDCKELIKEWGEGHDE